MKDPQIVMPLNDIAAFFADPPYVNNLMDVAREKLNQAISILEPLPGRGKFSADTLRAVLIRLEACSNIEAQREVLIVVPNIIQDFFSTSKP